jgi:hypothetical protein
LTGRRSRGSIERVLGGSVNAAQLINLEKHKDLLHTHHITHTKSNSDDSNLQALCALCHSKHPNHSHIWANLEPGQRGVILDLQSRRLSGGGDTYNGRWRPTPTLGAR